MLWVGGWVGGWFILWVGNRELDDTLKRGLVWAEGGGGRTGQRGTRGRQWVGVDLCVEGERQGVGVASVGGWVVGPRRVVVLT